MVWCMEINIYALVNTNDSTNFQVVREKSFVRFEMGAHRYVEVFLCSQSKWFFPNFVQSSQIHIVVFPSDDFDFLQKINQKNASQKSNVMSSSVATLDSRVIDSDVIHNCSLLGALTNEICFLDYLIWVHRFKVKHGTILRKYGVTKFLGHASSLLLLPSHLTQVYIYK